jgi:hypothetical protein
MRFTAKVGLAVLISICIGGGPTVRIAESAQVGIYKTSPFRYVIVYNKAFKSTAQMRQIWVLMDEKAFTEDNLRILYQLVVSDIQNHQRRTSGSSPIWRTFLRRRRPTPRSVTLRIKTPRIRVERLTGCAPGTPMPSTSIISTLAQTAKGTDI